MNILEIFRKRGNKVNASIGIGLGEDLKQNELIFDTSLKFLSSNQSRVVLFGKEIEIEHLNNSNLTPELKSRIDIITCTDPSDEITEFLSKGVIDCIVRGSLSASDFLVNIRNVFSVSKVMRLALLETSSGYQFFFGPVGIDECNDIESKIAYIKRGLVELNRLNLTPNISVLSGGRLGDLGRDSLVDSTLNMAEEVVDYFRTENPDIEIHHDEILIENSIRNKANLIVAPNGVSGNLIYRTLVHLGGGKAYGAIYMGLEKPVIDTSRVGNPSEIYGALILALAISTL